MMTRHLLLMLILIRFVLLNVTSFADTQEVRTALLRTKEVQKVTAVEEAPGVITWEVQSEEEAGKVLESLQGIFGKKYQFSQKQLPSGIVEIDLRL